MQFVVPGAVVGSYNLRVFAQYFADAGFFRVLVEDLAKLFQNPVRLGVVLVIFFYLEFRQSQNMKKVHEQFTITIGHLLINPCPAKERRVRAKLLILAVNVGHVEAEAVGAPLKPETDNAFNGPAHLGIKPVQVGLLRQKGMQVILLRVFIPGPGRSEEVVAPVVGWAAARPNPVAPDIPVPLRVLS